MGCDINVFVEIQHNDGGKRLAIYFTSYCYR